MATLFATAMLHLLACIPVARSQGLSQQCNTPAFANANATGYDSMVPLYAPVVPFADANVSTAILATDTQITQHFWFETPPLQPNNTVYISNNPSGGACLVLLDGFPNPNALRADLTAEKVFQGSRFCNSILSASCFEAIAEQSRADVNAAFKAGHFADPCAHVLQTAPAECNGTLAWTSSKGVKYTHNDNFFSGSPDCNGFVPFNGSASQGWILEKSLPLSDTDNLDTWSKCANILIAVSFDDEKAIINVESCPTANHLNAAQNQASDTNTTAPNQAGNPSTTAPSQVASPSSPSSTAPNQALISWAMMMFAVLLTISVISL